MTPVVGDQPIPGPLLFARYAYPPNERGYCGPADSRALLEYGAAGVVNPVKSQGPLPSGWRPME